MYGMLYLSLIPAQVRHAFLLWTPPNQYEIKLMHCVCVTDDITRYWHPSATTRSPRPRLTGRQSTTSLSWTSSTREYLADSASWSSVFSPASVARATRPTRWKQLTNACRTSTLFGIVVTLLLFVQTWNYVVYMSEMITVVGDFGIHSVVW